MALHRLPPIALVLLSTTIYAETGKAADVSLDEVVVYSRQSDLIGESLSASEGIIGAAEIDSRPILRTGEILEFVPGMVVTQHSGSGKANQYFLRTFNLDHGTDFRSVIDGMPINMRTHGHGQGYTDLNFIVPEFIDHITYQKGPYKAENGDFSTAGSATFNLTKKFDRPFAKIEAGQNQFLRTVWAGTVESEVGDLTLGIESQQYNGPWSDISEDVEKFNAMARLTRSLAEGELSVTLLAYDNKWNAADQIPQRAVDNNLINRLGSLDETVGGESSRYSLSAQWQGDSWAANGYIIQSKLNLFSNFTYFLNDPVNGDQFEQVDSRRIYGGSLSKRFSTTFGGKQLYHSAGLQFRFDDIDNVALHQTRARQRLSTVRQDEVEEYSAALFWESKLLLSDSLSTTLGLRYDMLHVDVESDLAANSGTDSDGLFSIKAGVSYQLADNLELYGNAGQSFHSNDARGATISVDPVSGSPAQPVDLLVRGEGGEIGLRYYDEEHFNISLALWMLELDSELLFVGDAGNTEASRASRRAGIELAAYYWLNDALSLDIELAWARARYTEDEVGEGNHINGALPFVASLGLGYNPKKQWGVNLRLRHFGKRTLDSFNNEQSSPFSVVNLGTHYEVGQWKMGLDLLNLLDSDDHDIDYFYESRLQGEAAGGVADNHFHPIEPRTVRFWLRYQL